MYVDHLLRGALRHVRKQCDKQIKLKAMLGCEIVAKEASGTSNARAALRTGLAFRTKAKATCICTHEVTKD